MSKSHFIIAAAAVSLLLLFPSASTAKDTQGFGTLKKIDFKGQRMQVSEYNWDTHEIDDVMYQYSSRSIEVFNIEKINDLKPGDELEFEWKPKGNAKIITRLSKGPFPMEALELLWDPNVEFDLEGAVAEGGMTEGTAPESAATGETTQEGTAMIDNSMEVITEEGAPEAVAMEEAPAEEDETAIDSEAPAEVPAEPQQ